jgi:hypothetical protein
MCRLAPANARAHTSTFSSSTPPLLLLLLCIGSVPSSRTARNALLAFEKGGETFCVTCRKDGATGLVIARGNGHRSISATLQEHAAKKQRKWKEQKKSRLKKTRTISLGE